MTRDEVIERLTTSGRFEIVEDSSAGYPMRVYRNAPRSFRALLESTRAYDERTFLIYGDEELTYKQHWGKVAALAHFLQRKGIRKGDRVAIGMRNYPEWVISFWACQAIGAIVVALNAWWTGAELAYALTDSTPAGLLIDGERLERLAPSFDKMAALKVVVVARCDAAHQHGDDFETVTAKAEEHLPDVEVEPRDYATILYTSGTTGKPKGAVAMQLNHMSNYMTTTLGGAVARGLLCDFTDLSPAEMPQASTLQTFPYFHIGGLGGLYLSTGTGAKIALMYKWDPHEAVRLIEKHQLSSVAGVPIVVRQLLETARLTGTDLSSLLGISSGGASVPPDLIRQIERQFDAKAAPANGYGLTETTSAIITNSGAEYFAKPDSVGRPTPVTDVRIVDEQGVDLGDNEVGELWARGPNVIPGYWQNPEATEASFGGGWFRTGDLCLRDSDGMYHVVDRKKDVIIRGGENVYCAEVEAAILEHALVKDVAVIGLPDADYGEQVGAVIQVAHLAAARSVPDELREKLAVTLAKFKIPSAYHLTTAELPRTATGKVLKRELREMFVVKA